MRIFRWFGGLLRALWRGLDTLRRTLHLILLVGLFTLLLAGALGRQAPIPPSAALLVNPTGVLVEQLEGNPLDRALAEVQGLAPRQTLLRDLVQSIERAADDKRITALVLQLDSLEGGGLAKFQEVGRALDRFRESGKPVIAVGSNFSRDQYYLAARADEIILHPLGLVLIEGYEYYRTFFSSALDKLRVDLNVFRVGEYKSFVEPYIRDSMSPEDKEASQRWLTALWTAWQEDVLAARPDLSAGTLADYADDLAARLQATGGDGAEAALAAGLVDRLMGRTDVTAYLIGLVGADPADDGSFSSVDFRRYARTAGLEARLRRPAQPAVGVVVAAGTIIDGSAPPGTVGGDTLAAQLQEARLDDGVAAVVIRVDSPGGSMFASELILEEVAALKAAGKPVVASMSSVAASGGYYIAMLADEIWSSGTTITGSIGVGALFPTVQRGLASLGIHVDGIGTTRLAGQFRLDRELGADAREALTLLVEDAYRVFVTRVAEARSMSLDRADSVARGRVWIGTDARELGLVDEFGGLDGAVAAAARRAGLEEGTYRVRYLEPSLSVLQRLLVDWAVGLRRTATSLGLVPRRPAGTGLLESGLRAIDRQVRELEQLNDPRGLYFHCLCAID